MRTKNITKHLILGALILTTGNVVGQTSVLGNLASGPTDFLGWDGSVTNNFPLEIRHDGAFPIQFWTSGSFRGLINERVIYPSLNTFPNIPADGFTLITPDMGFLNQPPRGPFSRLHLAEGGEDGNAEQWGYRPWQRNGVTFTGNTDQGYIGQKFREGGEDETDMVIQWSDNPGVDKADRLRFIFTSAYDQGTYEQSCAVINQNDRICNY